MIAKLKQKLAIHSAAKRLVRLFSGTATAKEQKRLYAWREQSPELQREFICTAHLLSDLDALENDPELLAIVGNRPKPATVLQSFAPGFALAAVLLIAIVLTFYTVIGPDDGPQQLQRYSTRIGEQKTITLNEGSLITLNTGTLLLVQITNKSRTLTLERGEAYFDVAPDPKRPFTVDMGERSVSVLGTRFYILKTPEQFTLSVVEGEVAVHRSEEVVSPQAPLLSPVAGATLRQKIVEQHRLRAGTVASFNKINQQLIAHTREDVDKLNSWRTGVIRFDQRPLSEVIEELNRYSAKKILIQDASIMNLKLFATVRLDRLDQALSVIELTMPIKVVRHFDRIVLKSNKNQ